LLQTKKNLILWLQHTQKKVFMMNESIKSKVRDIFKTTDILKNLARKTFMVDIVLSMMECRKVQFNEISLHINSEAKQSSIERRIQAFFLKAELDYSQVAILLAMILPNWKLTLCIDRTEWDIGAYQCNILMVTAYFNGIGIPLFYEFLENKSGNSNAGQRVDLIQKCADILGPGRIGMVIGDREFIGTKWLKWLKSNNIPFCMRVPKGHHITMRNGGSHAIGGLLAGHGARYFSGCMVDGVICNVFMKKLENGDYLYLVGSGMPKKLGETYRKRWSIEVCFQSFKGRGFDLEGTHLKDPKKLKKLVAFVSLSVTLCVNLGIYLHRKVQKIKTKKHGYKATSFFRNGLDAVRKVLKGKGESLVVHIMDALGLLLRWIQSQLPIYQHIEKMIG
jgi:hypothetical protein